MRRYFFVTVLAVFLKFAPVYSQSAYYGFKGTVEGTLVRRGSPRAHVSNGPVRSPFALANADKSGGSSSSGKSSRSASPSAATSSRTVADPITQQFGNLWVDPPRSPGERANANGSLSRGRSRRPSTARPQIQPDRSLASSSRTRSQRLPPRIPSEGESDSSANEPGRGRYSKVKIKANGPADVTWNNYGNRPGARTLQRGERFKQSFRSDAGMDANVVTRLGGKARVTVKGKQKVETFVQAHEGGAGSITPLLPIRGDTISVRRGNPEHRVQRNPPGIDYSLKFSTKIDGPGRIVVDSER